MKFAWVFLGALVLLLSGAVSARADSTEYAVTIYSYWQYSAFWGPAGYSQPGDPVLDQFNATYDMYSNGAIVPGTMSFNLVDSSGPMAGATPFTYGVVPTFCDPGVVPGQVGEGCTVPSNPPSGSTYAGGGNAWYDSDGFLIESGATPGQIGTTTGSVATIDCVYVQCTGGLFLCYDIDCAGGGNNPSSGGYITETSLSGVATTPEPSSWLLLLCGVPLLFLGRRRIQPHLTS